MAERSYHHGSLREELLTRAAEVIGEHGIEALTLRGLARDLGVSHGAPNRHFKSREELLATLATSAWHDAREATLKQADTVGDDPWIRLNAMGRGYLTWAIKNPALFAAATHPDVRRYADEVLVRSNEAFEATIRQAVEAAQAHGRHTDVNLTVLSLYTNAVPFGAAMLLSNPAFANDERLKDLDQFVADVIELVVPIRDRGTSDTDPT